MTSDRSRSLDWGSAEHLGAPVVAMPPDAVVVDLTVPPNQRPPFEDAYWIGRYDEDRPYDYVQPLFGARRTLHVGVDLGAPAGTTVHSFTDAVVEHAGYNPDPGDYGHVVVTKQRWFGRWLWALYGHLSAATLLHVRPGKTLPRGAVLGWLGAPAENGQWPPHLHFQLSVQRPETHDLPGVVARGEREQALLLYPDPRTVLGPLW